MLAGIIGAIAITMAPQDYNTDYFDVAELSDAEGCAIIGDWTLEGRLPIYVQFDLMTNGDVFVGVSSYGWSKPASGSRKLVSLAFRSPGQETTIYSVIALPNERLRPGVVGMLIDGETDAVVDAFAGRQSLDIYTTDYPEEGEELDRESLNLILQARLTGSGDAVRSAQRCVANVKRREDARRAREAQIDHIAKDPFAQ